MWIQATGSSEPASKLSGMRFLCWKSRFSVECSFTILPLSCWDFCLTRASLWSFLNFYFFLGCDTHPYIFCRPPWWLQMCCRAPTETSFVEKFPKCAPSQISPASDVAAAARTTKPVQFSAAGAPEAVDAAMFKLLLHEPAEPSMLVPAEVGSALFFNLNTHTHTRFYLIQKPSLLSIIHPVSDCIYSLKYVSLPLVLSLRLFSFPQVSNLLPSSLNSASHFVLSAVGSFDTLLSDMIFPPLFLLLCLCCLEPALPLAPSTLFKLQRGQSAENWTSVLNLENERSHLSKCLSDFFLEPLSVQEASWPSLARLKISRPSRCCTPSLFTFTVSLLSLSICFFNNLYSRFLHAWSVW